VIQRTASPFTTTVFKAKFDTNTHATTTKKEKEQIPQGAIHESVGLHQTETPI
jgi:hypothetical protein